MFFRALRVKKRLRFFATAPATGKTAGAALLFHKFSSAVGADAFADQISVFRHKYENGIIS